MTKEKAIRDLEAVEMMTYKYTEYLALLDQGGDWALSDFMKHLNSTTKKAREVLEHELYMITQEK